MTSTSSKISQERYQRREQQESLLTPGEVAALFRVDPKTVTRWAIAGRLARDTWIQTPGGHRRYRESKILALLEGKSPDVEDEL